MFISINLHHSNPQTTNRVIVIHGTLRLPPPLSDKHPFALRKVPKNKAQTPVRPHRYAIMANRDQGITPRTQITLSRCANNRNNNNTNNNRPSYRSD